jgi:hypothetical protein
MGAPDKNWLSFANQSVGAQDLFGQLGPPPSFAPWSDTLKFSNAWDAIITAEVVQGGAEDCLDANNGSKHLNVHINRWRSGGKQVATLKGGLVDIELSGMIEVHGSNTDIELDNYSDQSHERCADIRLNLTTLDGSPVHYKSWMGVRPKLLNGATQKYVCDLYLPYPVGFVWNWFYYLLKLVHLAK